MTIERKCRIEFIDGALKGIIISQNILNPILNKTIKPCCGGSAYKVISIC